MDSDEDFKHYSSCYYDDDADRAFYPENAQHQLQLDTKSWSDNDKTTAAASAAAAAVGILQSPQCPPQQLMLDNIVSSSDKLYNSKNVERWTCNTQLSNDLTCDVELETGTLQSVSTDLFLHLI